VNSTDKLVKMKFEFVMNGVYLWKVFALSISH